MSVFVARLSRHGEFVGISHTNSAHYAHELNNIATILYFIFENRCDGYAKFRQEFRQKKIDDCVEQDMTARLQKIGDAFGLRVIIQPRALAAIVELRAHNAGDAAVALHASNTETESILFETLYVPQSGLNSANLSVYSNNKCMVPRGLVEGSVAYMDANIKIATIYSMPCKN